MRTRYVRDAQPKAVELTARKKSSPSPAPPVVLEPLEPDQALLSSYCSSNKSDKHETPQDHYFEYVMPDSINYAFASNEPRWQFMIRLEPNLHNLSNAANALSKVFIKYKLNFQLFHPAQKNPTIGYDPVKDYTLFKPQTQALVADDRSATKAVKPKLVPIEEKAFAETPDLDLNKVNQYRVGQELRVEIGNENFQYDAATYKTIMLECIKALQDEGVKFGCLNAPMGSIDVPCEKGIPPLISYGYFKPLTEAESRQRYSVIPKEEYNPEQGNDPLAGIKLTKDDFINAGIDPVALEEDGKRRIKEQKQHLEDAIKAITAELRLLCDNRQAAQYSLLNKATLAANMPLLPEDKHQPFMDESFIAKLSLLPADFNAFLDEEQRATSADFQTNHFAMTFLNSHLPQNNPHLNPTLLCTKDLKKMQILYLRLVHLEYEQKCLNATLLSIEGNLKSIYETLSTQSRIWQRNNLPLHQSIMTLGEEMAKLPEAEQKSPLYMDIATFLNNALPMNLRSKNIMSTGAAQDQSEEARKATLRAQLKAIAAKLHGKGPTWGKVLGALLIAGGILLGGLCVLALIPSLGISSLPGFTLSTWMLASGAGFFGLTAGVGIGACVYSRDTGPSKTVQNLAAAV